MRLTIINQFYVPDISPTAHLAASLAEHRAARGDQATVVASRGGYVPTSGTAEADERQSNPRVYRIWTPRFGKATVLKRCIDYACFYLLALWRMLQLPPQDVIISLTTPPYIAWTGVLHKLLHRRAKLILWNMDCYPELAERSGKIRPGGAFARAMRAMNRALFRRLDHLICLDTAMVELLQPQYAPARRSLPISVIPNWEPAHFFPKSQIANRKSQIQNPFPDLRDRFVILYLGNTGYGHSFETVIDAARILRDDRVTFLFVGGGSRWEGLERARAEHRLDNLLLHGYVPKEQTPAVLAAADCSLITLRDEILGVMSPSKLHGCLAMHLPVIYVGPPGSNVDDAIRQFGCGVSLRHGDVDLFVDAVRKMKSCPENFKRIRQRARDAFDSAYCDTRTLPRFDRIIDDIAS